MAKKAKKRVDSEKKEVLVKGKHAEQLKMFQQKLGAIQAQQAQLKVALINAVNASQAIIDFYVGADEEATDYDSSRSIITIEKKPKQEEVKK